MLVFYGLGLCLGLFFFLSMYNNIVFFNFFTGWLVLFFLIFWLYSTFIFFFKHYSFSNFVSSISSFWNSSFNLFWVVESCWFIVFIYCLLTASHEPSPYEEIYIYNNLYVGSLKIFLINNVLVVSLILLLLFSTIFNNYVSTGQFGIYMLWANFFLLLFFFVEIYQFTNIISFFWELGWVYNNSLNISELVVDYWRFSPRVAFFSLMLVANFWHCIFIIGAWIIFFLSISETSTFSTESLSMNAQNLIIFYILGWVQLLTFFNWYIKFLVKKLWFWFFVNPTIFILNSIYVNIVIFLNTYFWHVSSLNFFLCINTNYKFFYFVSFTKFGKVNFSLTYLINNLL